MQHRVSAGHPADLHAVNPADLHARASAVAPQEACGGGHAGPARFVERSLDLTRQEPSDSDSRHREPARPGRRRGVRERVGDLVELVAVRGGVTPRAVIGLLLVGVAVVAILGVRLALVSRHARAVPLQATPVAATADAARAAGGSAGTASGVSGPGEAGITASGPASAPAGAGVSGPGGASASASAATTGTVVVIHVVGEVRHAGVVRLPAGSRVEQALAAAGGATSRADLVRVNLARPVMDGEQILVPRPGQVLAGAPGPVTPAGGAPGQGTSAGAPAIVDLNTATLTELDALPGIGPILAQRILDWRGANGRFRSVDDLGEVSGVGDKLLAQVRPRVRV